ncbi:MAG: CHAD domain-containing protein [Anaerolineaceae bacterium]|nr:CHAD domain-containing protein [Anaerolineaceae bacterium]
MKAKEDLTVCAYGAAALLQHVNSLREEWEGVCLAEDIEYVHRMRVATRRFRSVFDIFSACLPKKKRAAWETEISRLTKALSKARDLDVHIAMLESFSQTLPESQYHPGVHRLQLRLNQKRAHVQPQIVDDLNRMRKMGVLDEIEKALQKMIPPQTETPSPYSPPLYHLAFKSINRCMNNLLGYDGRIQNPKKVEALHDMRLEAKSLRYTIEIFQNLYTDRLEVQLEIVKDIQAQLGDIHDDDNWLIDLDKFLNAERERTLAYYGHERPFNLLVPGIEYLRKERQKNRNRQYREFIKKWEKWKAENLWGSLYQATKLPTIIYQPEPEISEKAAPRSEMIKETQPVAELTEEAAPDPEMPEEKPSEMKPAPDTLPASPAVPDDSSETESREQENLDDASKIEPSDPPENP